MAVTDTACWWHAFCPRKFQMVLPCTSTDRHTIAVNTESDMVKLWISPSPSFTHNLTCHFWKSKSINAEVCLTEWNLRWSMPYLGFWRHAAFSCSSYLRLKCCSHRECCVLKSILCPQHQISNIVSVRVEQTKILEIGWALSEGIPLPTSLLCTTICRQNHLVA